MYVVRKIFIVVVLGVLLWLGGYYVGAARVEQKRTEETISRITHEHNQRNEVRTRVLTVSRADNACWLCKNYAAADDGSMPADVAVCGVSTDGQP